MRSNRTTRAWVRLFCVLLRESLPPAIFCLILDLRRLTAAADEVAFPIDQTRVSQLAGGESLPHSGFMFVVFSTVGTEIETVTHLQELAIGHPDCNVRVFPTG